MHHPGSEEDTLWMARALELAAIARGRTSPNPLVGALLVRDGVVIAEGWHRGAGEAHAERVALEKASTRAKGATLYVNLEPCVHFGRTPPCAPALAEAGIERVVSAMEDPDPRVRGAGHAALRERGVAVDVGVLEGEARRLNEEFTHRVRTGRAFGVLKAAITLDGRLASDTGDSRWITGEAARARAHELRDRYDAVLIGRGTLERDDPALDVRLPGDRRDPAVVVVDSKASSPLDRKVFRRAASGARVFLAVTGAAPEENLARFRAIGVTPIVTGSRDTGRVDLRALFEELACLGLNSAMIEGGEKLHTGALASGLIGRAHVFIAPKILGGAGGPRLVGDLGLREVGRAIPLQDIELETLGSDILVTGRIAEHPKLDPPEER
jgi:diaminohydroxyphosphoribosylaminopyrimidine deaminase/5-amino-6-(5-phosphoribosylamino)uracil reductase